MEILGPGFSPYPVSNNMPDMPFCVKFNGLSDGASVAKFELKICENFHPFPLKSSNFTLIIGKWVLT